MARREPPLTEHRDDEPLGVILTGGMGTRLRPLTHEMPKALVPILNRPLIAYGLDLLAAAGLHDIVVVVAGNDHRTGPTAVEEAPDGVRVAITVQPEPRGSGDAVLCAGPALDGRKVIVLAVDALLQGDLRSQVDAFMASNLDAWLLLHPTDRPREMGIAILEGDRVTDLEEKPEHPRSDLALCGIWMLTPAVIERLEHAPFINAKGEVDLSATVAVMLRDGGAIGGRRFDGRWLDVGALGSLLTTQHLLLTEHPLPSADGGAGPGRPGGEGVRITQPVLIAPDATVTDCALGPNVVVGAGAVLNGVQLEHGLVASGARVENFRGAHVVIAPSGEVGQA